MDSPLPKLQDDCWICQNLNQPSNLVIRETKTSIAKLNPDQLFPGYTFITLKWHEEHLTSLPPRDQRRFLEDMTTIAHTLNKALQPDRINYELLGNAQPHLHWHLIPRYTTDPMWGRPVWAGSRRRKRLTEDAYKEMVDKLKNTLAKARDTDKAGSE